MSLRSAGPGKTAPKLAHDFARFDPRAARPNILLEFAPPQGDGVQPTPHHTSCKHEYATKDSQSILPSLDLRSDGSTRYKLAVVCKKCQIHADIKIDTSSSLNPCPTSSAPLHHFRLADNHTTATSSRIVYEWGCSVDECRCTLSITYRLPRLKDEYKRLLTDDGLLKRRYEHLKEAEPDREGVRQATDMEALSRLRRYVHDSLDPKHTKRQFPANNKRFQEAFGMCGQDCLEMFEFLGFKYAEGSWNLPSPGEMPDRWNADGSSDRELLEDAEMELLACMYKVAAVTGAVVPPGNHWTLAGGDVERTLGAQGCLFFQHSNSVTQVQLTDRTDQRYAAFRKPSNEEAPYFNSLGALSDFGDTLIEFCYDQQTLCDPDRSPYYFECLQVITDGRQSEQLQMKVAMLESRNTVSRRDLNAAYNAFNIPWGERATITDQSIIDRFQALLGDQAPPTQQRSREHLYKLGAFRNSPLLINASRQTVETYEDALVWLGNGVTKDTTDDGLIAVYGVKIDGCPGDEEIGKRAMSVIARERKSSYLNNWLLTGRLESDIMTVDEALRYFQVETKLEEVEPTIMPTLFEAARFDRPGDFTERAIATVQEAMRSTVNCTGPATDASQHAPATWPVGLISHGNTCYLNSLLQYYFSIQPIRDIVLNYEKYQMDTNGELHKSERVGHLIVDSFEIQAGQRFAQDLKHLFQRMIKEHGSTVRPEDDLVCRAFLNPKDYHLMGAAANKDDAVGEAKAVLTNGDAPKTDDDVPMETIDSKDASLSSSQTLQGDADANMINAKDVLTPPESPKEKPEPEHKPPLPPRMPLRRYSTVVRQEALKLAKEEATKQQDVAEVHDSVMGRLRCGMTPQGQDSKGEQEDPLRNLYSIGYLETVITDGVPQKPEVGFDSSITCDVPREDTDIYQSLDKWFDPSPSTRNNEDIESYKSIKTLPSILQISTPRIDFDMAQGGAFKSTKMVRLYDEIYLDRYTDHSHPSALAKRKECWAWKAKLRQLKGERTRLTDTGLDINSPEIFSHTAQFLAGLDEVNAELEAIGSTRIDADGDITAALETAAHDQAARLLALDAEIDDLQRRIAAQFEDTKNIKYRLAAVFFHRGNTGSGHYWTYIHDFQQGLWRKYNDETVEEQKNADEILAANAFMQGTPTYIVYVAEDKLDFVQPVCREPEEAPAAVKEDTVMGGSESAWEDLGNDPVPQPRSQMEAMDPEVMGEEGEKPAWDQSAENPLSENVKW